MTIRYSTNGVRDNQVHEADISKKFTVAQFCQHIPFRFWQNNIAVSSSQQQITGRQAQPQEHNPQRQKKKNLRGKT